MKKIANHFKENISDLIILFIVICNYFGLLFIFNGSIIGIILSLIFSIVIGVFCWFIKEKLIENKNINFKNKLINKFNLLWLIFIFIGLLNYLIISHIYNINFNYKVQIQKNVTEKLSSVQAYSNELNKRIVIDYQNLHNTIKQNKIKLNFSLNESNSLADNLTSAPRQQALNEWNKNDSIIKYNNLMFGKVFKDWQVTELVNNYNELIKYNDLNYNKINLLLSNLPIDKSALKEPNNKSKIPLNNPFKLNLLLSDGLSDYLIPFLIILITHLIVLIPYFKIHKQFYHEGKEPKGAKII